MYGNGALTMVRHREKAVITKPSKQQTTKITPIKHSPPPSHEVVKPIVLLSLLVGYIPTRFKLPGILGGLFWFVSLFLHTAFDFMSARKLYGYGWAFIQFLLFANLAMCTYAARFKAVPWLELSLFQLEKEKKYLKTFARIRKLFRAIPWVVVIFSFLATGLQFFCFYYDGAFSVSFEQQVSNGWRITLLVVWFLTNVHMLFAFSLFWCLAMCNMYTTGYSMTEYHEIMTVHLKNKQTPVTFRQAVHSFAERGTFLKKSASACRISLTFLLVYSIASLAVNAFYYLYKTRQAAYIYFALMPPICSVYPLCLAAWVTKQYQWYLTVVVKAWAERPESSDEEEESGSDQPRPNKDKQKTFARKFTKRVKSADKKDKDHQDEKPRRRSLFVRPMSAGGGGTYSDTEGNPGRKGTGQKDNNNDKPRRGSLFVRTTRQKLTTSGSYSDSEGHPEVKSSKTDNNDRRQSLLKRATRPKPLSNGAYSDSECYPEKKVNFDESPLIKKKLFLTKKAAFTSEVVSNEDKPTTVRFIDEHKKTVPTEKPTFTSVSDTEVVSEPTTVRFIDEHKPSTKRLNHNGKSTNEMNDNKPNLGRINNGFKPNIGELTPNTLKPKDIKQSTSDDEAATDDEGKPNSHDEKEERVNRKRVMDLILRGTARAVGRLKHRAKMPKFNFEKYISYLQNVLPTVGFKIMGITVTWEMVSTILFLEVSLLALFMQESIFGNQKANVSL